MAPAYVLAQQDPSYLGAVDVDSLTAQDLGEAVEGPHPGIVSSAARSSPPAVQTSRPGGGCRASSTIRERWASVILGLRPTPGRSARTSRPCSVKRRTQQRAVFGEQPSVAAMTGTWVWAQLSSMICARRIQSAGACRDPASLWTVRSSVASAGGRANNSLGMIHRLTTIIPRRTGDRPRQ